MAEVNRNLLPLRLAAACCAVLQPALAYALPAGGQVDGGQATISTNTTETTINQTSVRAVIDWDSFNVGEGESVRFDQPSASAIALNRIHDTQASQIDGAVTANGRVWLINPEGIVFGSGSQVNVGGLIASTADINNERFMAGDDRFDIRGNPNASVVNHGHITVQSSGLAALVAPHVVNDGVISADLGAVHLGSGDTFSLDLYGDGLINLQASDAVIDQLVDNRGTIRVDGGSVMLTAATAQKAVNSLINMSGVIDARAAGDKAGQVDISAPLLRHLVAANGRKLVNSTVLVSGSVNVTGMNSGEKGGGVIITGDHVGVLPGASIDASGRAGGGSVKIGGDFHGEGATPTAGRTLVESGATIRADATENGKGGAIAVWSDDHTDFAGTITARGGASGGDGGFIETSGHNTLTFQGTGSAAAPRGNAGTWLLDPNNVTINAGATSNPSPFTANWTSAGASNVFYSDIQSFLNGGTNVTINASGSITVAHSIAKTAGANATLDLEAGTDIVVNSNVAISSTGNRLNVTFDADTALGGGAVYMNTGSSITTNGGNIIMGGRGSPSTLAAVGDATHTSGIDLETATLNAGGGTISLRGNGYGSGAGSNYGVLLANSTAQTNGSGSITMIGAAGSGTGDWNQGVDIDGSTVSSVNGDVTLTGTGGASTGNGSNGVVFEVGGTVSTSGTGNVVITGTGGATGAGQAQGSSGIILQATGGNISTAGGSITMTGIMGTGGNNIYGMDSQVAANTIGGNTTGGDVTLIADSVYFDTGNSVKTTGNLTVKPYTNGTAMNIGSNTGGLDLSSTILGYFNLGTAASATFGDTTNTGAMSLNYTTAFSKPVSFLTGTSTADISVAGNLTSSVTSGNAITMTAGRDILVTSGKTITASDATTTDSNSVILRANRGIDFKGTSKFTSSGVQTNLTLQADYDGDADGYILLNDNSAANGGIFATKGGNITLGGSSGTITTGSGFAYGDATSIYGVALNRVTLDATSAGATGGNIIVNGVGYANGSNNHGVYLDGGLGGITLLTKGTGTISVTGQGGGSGAGGGNYGIYLKKNSSVAGITSTGGGAITLTGIDGAGSGGGNYGLITDANTNTVGGASASGPITLTTDDWSLGAGTSIRTTAAITIANRSSGTTVGVGGGAGTLSITDTYLGYLSGYSGLTLGSGTAGAMDINSLASFAKPVTFLTGGGATPDITLNHQITDSSSGTALIFASGRDFINNVGAGVMNLTGGGSPRWLIYSTSAASDTPNGLTAANYVYDKTYASYPPGSVTETGNTWIYAQYLGTITLTADDKSMAYGATLPSFTYAFSCSTGCGQGVMSGSPFLTTTATPSSNVGTYSITASQGTAAANGYQFSFGSGTLAVNPAPLTVTADAGQTKVYGAANPGTYTYSYSGFVNGDTSAVFSGALSRAAGENAGTYAIGQGTLSAGSNYAVSFNGDDFAITPASLTVTADNKTRAYGAANPSLTYQYSGLVNGDTSAVFSGGLTTTGMAGSNAGTYAIARGTLSAGGNYALSYTAGTLTVNPAALTVTADVGQTKVYGAANPGAYTYGYSGLVNGDTSAVFSGALSRVAGENVGTYTIGQGTLSAGGNYAISYNADFFAVTPAALTVTADDKSKTYGAANPALTYQYSGLVNGDTNAVFSGGLTTAGMPSSNAGTYAITQGTLSAGGNYALSYTAGTLTVNPAALTVTADAGQSKVYGATNPAYTYSYSGLVNGDTSAVFSGALNRAAGENVGTYAISQGTFTAGSNYAISFTGDDFAISPAALTVIALNKSKYYGDADPAYPYTYVGLVNGDTGAVFSGSLTRVPGEDMGSYAILQGALAAGGNYAIGFTPGTFTIAAQPSRGAVNVTRPGTSSSQIALFTTEFQATADGLSLREPECDIDPSEGRVTDCGARAGAARRMLIH